MTVLIGVVMTMRQGTTPTHTFMMPFETSNISKVQIVYAQDDEEVLRKETDECNFDGRNVSVTLTQEETFLFDIKKNVQIQIRVLTEAADALASNIMSLSVHRCLDDGVL